MISIDLEIMEEVLNEYAANMEEFVKKSYNTFSSDIKEYLVMQAYMSERFKTCSHFCQGFMIALMMVQYQKIKDETLELERLSKLQDNRSDER